MTVGPPAGPPGGAVPMWRDRRLRWRTLLVAVLLLTLALGVRVYTRSPSHPVEAGTPAGAAVPR